MSNYSVKEKEVATWLVNKIETEGKIKHIVAINQIEQQFGDSFIHISSKGNKSVNKKVLSFFRTLKPDTIKWDVGQKSWIIQENAMNDDFNKLSDTAHIPTAVQARDVTKDIPINHPSLFLNRELGWLDFNWRVLFQAMDHRNPLLERVQFLAITVNNLDEFVQKRVGGLKRQKAAGVTKLSPDGRTPKTQIKLVQQNIKEMQECVSKVWNDTLQAKIKETASIKLSLYNDLNEIQREELDKYFLDHIYPILTPLAVDPGHPFPFISNLSLSLAVKLKHPDWEEFSIARVKIPANQPRLLQLEDEDYLLHYIPIEEVIRHNIGQLFPGMEILSVSVFRVTRNADIRRDEEEAEDLLSMISDELRERRFADVVRLEIEENVGPLVLALLKDELHLHDSDNEIIYVKGLLDLTACFEIAKAYIPDLHYPQWEPIIPKRLNTINIAEDEINIFDTIKKGGIFVHHPYESFSGSVRHLIESAANDPDVVAIKQTLYRTSDDSPIVKALIRAAEKGKQVAVLVEVKARFDEASNIEFGKRLKNAGVHVAYGLVGLKTHAKILLIVREEGDKHVSYCHIGTGNYHIHTAEIYTDLGLITSDKKIASDITNLFHYLTGFAPDQKYRKLLVAPDYLRNAFYKKIDREIENATSGGSGRIIAKMNALDDTEIIQRLYEASQAGVKIDLIIRGHSRLRPGLPNYSQNIRIISIIGRFLEHDRIYYFENGGKQDIFIGSADWRQRNMDERVEALVPITNLAFKKRIRSILKNALTDNRLAWDMHSDGSYSLRHATNGDEEKNFHQMLMKNVHQSTHNK